MKVNIGKYPKNGLLRKVSVKIDSYDTWNADHTLALIITPLLEKMKEKKQGAPLVDDDDVPDELKSTSADKKEHEWDTDSNHFKRWDWVLDEMIYAMREISEDNPGQHKFFDDSDILDSENLFDQLDKMKVDIEGLDAYNERILNACKLFGKYFQSLWS
jgi:hypothetical protein